MKNIYIRIVTNNIYGRNNIFTMHHIYALAAFAFRNMIYPLMYLFDRLAVLSVTLQNFHGVLALILAAN